MIITTRFRIACFTASLLAVFVFGFNQAQAQQDPGAKQNPETNPPSTTDGDTDSAPRSPIVTPSPVAIQEVGGAHALLESISPLRWGSFYISSAQYSQVFDKLSDSGNQGSIRNDASLFSSTLVFDKSFRASRIAFQYVPRMVVLNGDVLENVTNQDTSIDTVFVLSPRWTLGIGDRFAYYKTGNTFGDLYLDADSISGTTVQRNLVEGPVSWLSNTVNASFGYSLSARTQMSFTPTYVYASTSDSTVPAGNAVASQYGGRFNISHLLTPRSSIQAYYTATDDVYHGVAGDTLYQTLGLGYGFQFGSGWSLNASGGGSSAGFSSGRQWTASGSFSITKAFRRSTAALAYSRGHTLTGGYIRGGFTDRADATWSSRIGQRVGVAAELGYERSITSSNFGSGILASGVWGKYGLGKISYQLLPSVSLFATYVHKWQRGNDVQVYSGERDYVQFGIRWSSGYRQY